MGTQRKTMQRGTDPANDDESCAHEPFSRDADRGPPRGRQATEEEQYAIDHGLLIARVTVDCYPTPEVQG